MAGSPSAVSKASPHRDPIVVSESLPHPPTLVLRSHVHSARVIYATFAAELRLLACVDTAGVVSITDVGEGTCLHVRQFDPDKLPTMCEFA